MGWNEASVHFVADGWDLVVEEIELRTRWGNVGLLTSVEKSLDFGGDVLRADAIERWLLQRGFLEVEKTKSGKNYRHEDVLVAVNFDDVKVKIVMLEFTLTRDSPSRWHAWEQFANEICDSWPISLADWEARMKVGPKMLFPLLQRTIAWQDFEQNFGWPSPVT